MTLDPKTQRGLHDVAKNAGAGLDQAARARILAQLSSTGPKIVRRARIQRVVTRSVAAVAVLGLVGLAAYLNKERAAKTNPSLTPAPMVAQPAPAKPCDAFAELSGASLQDGLQDLGDRARIFVEPGSRVTLTSGASCATILHLEKGRATVHARNLGGGQLIVAGEFGEVEVRGTIFSVGYERELDVEVAEGVVEVRPKKRKKRRLRAGRRARTIAQAPVIEEIVTEDRVDTIIEEISPPDPTTDVEPAALAPDPVKRKRRRRARRKRVVEAPEPVAPAPPVSLAELIRQAEAFRRSGDLDRARDRYRAAGSRSGPTAEAAWVGLAKLELSAGRARSALSALDARRARFKSGVLTPEAEWLEVQAAARLGDLQRARRSAERLRKQHRGTPQSKEARRWLEQNTP